MAELRVVPDDGAEETAAGELPSEDVAAALEHHATSLEAQAMRLRQIAVRVREQGLRATGRVKVADPEAQIRNFLLDTDLASDADLAEDVGWTVAKLRKFMRDLEADGKVASVKRGGQTVYAWIAPERKPGKHSAPRSEGMVTAEVRRDAEMIYQDRGTPVRLSATRPTSVSRKPSRSGLTSSARRPRSRDHAPVV
jgi:hypothetical protein